MPKRARIPSCRLHKPSGRAVVTLCGRDFYLGDYGTPKSQREYDKLINQWLENDRQLPEVEGPLTVNALIVSFWEQHVTVYYVKNGEPTDTKYRYKAALKYLRRGFGQEPAGEFRALSLKACRRLMIEDDLARSTINEYVKCIKDVFRWAAGEELVPADVPYSLRNVDGLKKERSEARETDAIPPVADEHVDAIKDYVARPVWAMIRLQLLNGMRPGEVIQTRAVDIEMADSVWIYRPESHKTEHHDRDREVYLGPRAQLILRPFLSNDLYAPLFSPRQAEAERRAEQRRNRKTPVQPSQRNRRKAKPKWRAGAQYTNDSYCRAIVRAIKKVNEKRAEEELPAIPRWTPNQLRHSAATRIRKEEGLETSQVMLGHSQADVTQVYAERDRNRGMDYAARCG